MASGIADVGIPRNRIFSGADPDWAPTAPLRSTVRPSNPVCGAVCAVACLLAANLSSCRLARCNGRYADHARSPGSDDRAWRGGRDSTLAIRRSRVGGPCASSFASRPPASAQSTPPRSCLYHRRFTPALADNFLMLEPLIALQRWIYGSIGSELSGFATTRNWWLLATLLPVGIVFGAIHALTPGHGKTVLASYLV